MAKAKSWPEGLSDAEAVQRFRTLCLAGCDGIQDLSDDARYKALRKTFAAITEDIDRRRLSIPRQSIQVVSRRLMRAVENST